jgi:hypothetical protein
MMNEADEAMALGPNPEFMRINISSVMLKLSHTTSVVGFFLNYLSSLSYYGK